METAVTEKKETSAGTTGEGAPVGTTVETNMSGENKEQVETAQESTPPAQVTPLVINEEKLNAEEKAKAVGGKSKTVFAHIALMEANNLKPEKLPTELKMRINAWAMGVRKYDKNPTPKLMEMNKKGSVSIADAIQNWVEKDLPEKTNEQIIAENKAKEDKIRIENETKARERENQERMRNMRAQKEEAENRQREELARKERELKAKREVQEKAESAKRSIEQRVQAILTEKGKIRYKELVEILGHDVGESVQVGSIKLLNVYFTNSYKQIK